MSRFEVNPSLRNPLAEAGVRSARDLVALALPRDAHSVGTAIDLPVEDTVGRFYLKAYRYPSWRKSKGLLGRGSGWGIAPCLREFRNLTWLRAHGIGAVRPIAAASISRGRRLVAHALLTEWYATGVSLATVRHMPEHLWASVLPELGRTIKRMHARGFVHRDLHARNVLVECRWERDVPVLAAPQVTLLDCRRGGPPSARRGLDFDLHTLKADLSPMAWQAVEAAYRSEPGTA